MNAKNLMLLAIVTLSVVVVTIVIVVQKQPSIPLSTEQLVFPELLGKVDAVTEINIATKEDHFTIVKGEKYWGLQEKHQYPVAIDKVSQLILGLAELKTVEAKTANPELYSKLGVEDITAENAQSVLFTLKDSAGNALASLIVGENQISKTDATRREFYLRKADDKQTWLALGILPVDKKASQWLDKQVLSVENTRMQQVQVLHADGEKVTIFRDAKENEDYQIVGLSEQMKVKSMYTLKQMAGVLTDLTMNDVTVPSEMTFTPEASTQAVFNTFDGLEITMTLITQEDKHFARFAATFVPDKVKIKPEVKADSVEEKLEKLTPESVKTEAESLQEKLKAWVFEIPAYKATALVKRQGDLVDAKPREEVVEDMGHATTQAQKTVSPEQFSLPPLEEVLGHPVTVH